MKWLPIDQAPRDGTLQFVKRVHNGQLVKKGRAFWGRHPDPEFAEEGDRWMNEDGEFSFPSPTHWLPGGA